MENFTEILSWVDDQQDRMVETVKAWSRINSGSRNLDGIRDMGAAAVEAFSVLGAELEVCETKPGTRVNLKGEIEADNYGPVYRFRKRPGANRKVLLTGGIAHLLQVGARFPGLSVLGTIGAVFPIGMLASLAAVRRTLRAPLLPALKAER